MRIKNKRKSLNYKIAVVDDEQGIIDSLSVIIKQLGYSYKCFTNPLYAIEELKKEHFDMLILDYIMDPIHGDQVINEIRKFDKDLYIILLTGHKDLVPPFETIRKLDIQDYCEKSDKFERIKLSIESGVKVIQLMRNVKEVNLYNKNITEFFANISHEFKTPLNIIFSSIQLLVVYRNNDDKDVFFNKSEKYYGTIKQNCYRLLRLINNLLDASKFDSEFIELNLQNLDIVSSVENITLSIAPFAENKDINLIFDTEIEEKITAFDSEKIERVVLNLLSNAIKFTDKGGSIFVNLFLKDENIIISIKDTGIGIPQDKIKFVFERFKQIDKTFKRSHEGTGLGLSIVKNFLEMHNGKIELESKLNQGSEFIITLPCRTIQEDKTNGEMLMNDITEKINIELSDIL